MSAKKKPVLPDTEIQSLADAVVLAWTLGEPVAQLDSLGGLWEFEPVRDTNSRVEIRRSVVDEDATADSGVRTYSLGGQNVVSGAELGVDEVRSLVASRILAIANPA